MPDDSGELSPEELEYAMNKLIEMGVDETHCRICSSKHSRFPGKRLVAGPIYSQSAFPMGGAMYVNLALICRICGHTDLFNAQILGLLDEAGNREFEKK